MAKLYFCSCAFCKRGRKSKWNQARLKKLTGGVKSDTKVQLRKGNYERLKTKVSAGIMG